MAKVMIDAGHGGTTDPGAVYGGRQEKDDNLKLALAVGEILEQNGAEVLYTRTEDIYQRPIEKAQIANASGADYFVSLHRNSSPRPGQYSGAETLVYSNSGEKARMAETINRNLEQAGFRNLGVEERPDLIVLRRTQMPAVLVETGFINTDADNLLFDQNFDAIAQAIADGILEVAGDQDGGGTEKLYRVQTGAFRSRANAEELLYRLLQEGYPAFILAEEGLYKVQAGAFRNLENAVLLEAELRGRGYSTYITA